MYMEISTHELDSHRRGSNVIKTVLFLIRLEDIDPEVAEIIDRSRERIKRSYKK